MMEGRPRGMMFASYREYKRAKRNFRRALDVQHMCDVYRDIDEAAEMDISLFWKLTKRRKCRASQIYPEIQDENGTTHTNPEGVTETFAQCCEKIYTPLQDDNFHHDFKSETELEIRR